MQGELTALASYLSSGCQAKLKKCYAAMLLPHNWTLGGPPAASRRPSIHQYHHTRPPQLTSPPLQEFNARTAHYTPGTPIPARITVRPDRSFHFSLRTPPTATLLLSAAGAPAIKSKIRGAGNVPGPMNNHEGAKGKTSANSPTNGNAVKGTVGTVSLKHVFEIARIKQGEARLRGLSLEGLARSVVGQAGSLGVVVVP